MKIKVADAHDLVLDYMVAKAKGYTLTSDGINFLLEKGNELRILGPNSGLHFSPTTDWGQGGDIMDEEDISVIKLEPEYGVDSKGYATSKRIPVYGAVIGDYFDTDQQRNSYGESWGDIYYIGQESVTTGPSKLTAAMRCYAASELGAEVEVPDELWAKSLLKKG
jgi:hypothetical protein